GPQRIFALESSDGLDGVGTTDGLHSGFGESEVADLALLNQVFHRARNVFDRNSRVNTVLVEEIDHPDLKAPERALDGLPDVLRPAVDAWQPLHPAGVEIRIQVEAEFG